MTKAHTASTPSLQSFFPSQKSGSVTRSRAKLQSGKTPVQGAQSTARKRAGRGDTIRLATTTHTGSPLAKEVQEESVFHVGLKRRAEEVDPTPCQLPENRKRLKTGEKTRKLRTTPQRIESNNDARESESSPPSKGTSTPYSRETRESPYETADRTTHKITRPAPPRFVKIDATPKPPSTLLDSAILPSPRAEHQPEVHDPKELSSPSTAPTTPTKPSLKGSTLATLAPNSTSKVLPAHQRYRHLIIPGKKLLLPSKYETLEKMFNALEYTVMFMRGRDQKCVYHKIRKAVENVCHRDFEIRNLAQIRHVFPEAYTYQSVQTIDQGVRVTSVCIEVPMPESITQPSTPTSSPLTSPSVIRGGTLAAPSRSALDSVKMRATADAAASSMGERRKEFHGRLVRLVRVQHDIFLDSLTDTVRGVNTRGHPGEDLMCWHPRFDLDSVPEIEEADMPELKESLPDFRNSIASSSRKQMEAAAKTTEEAVTPQGDSKTRTGLPHPIDGPADMDLGNMERVDTPPPRVLGKVGGMIGVVPGTPETPKQEVREAVMPKPPTKPRSKASDILARIRERERKAIEKAMYEKKPSPDQIRERAMMARLGDLAQALSFMMSSANKSVMPLANTAKKMADSLTASLSESEAAAHIRLLAQVVPQWCTVTDLDMAGTVVRIKNGAMSIKDVRDAIKARMAADSEELK